MVLGWTPLSNAKLMVVAGLRETWKEDKNSSEVRTKELKHVPARERTQSERKADAKRTRQIESERNAKANVNRSQRDRNSKGDANR
jgi:hypothetical protein